MRRFPVRLAAGVLAAALVPHALHAQGYGVYEQGACTMARAGAAVANTCNDGSAMFFNPAGLVAGSDSGAATVVSVGGTLVGAGGNFTDRFTGRRSDLMDKVVPVPNVYVTRRLRPNLSAGVGLFAPYGLTIDWDPNTSQGRFLGYHSKIAAIYLQPTVAYKFLQDRLSLGAGFDLSLVSVGLSQRVDLATTPTTTPGVTFGMLGVPTGTDFADIKLTGSGTGVGYHVGGQLKLTDQIQIGARYLSRQLVKINNGTAEITQVPTGLSTAAPLPSGSTVIPAGTKYDDLVGSQFAAGGPLATQAGSTYLRLPNQLVLGVAVKPVPKATLMFDYQYTYWAVFNQLQINFERLGTKTIREAYKGTPTFRLGGEYEVTPTTAVRLGWYTHRGAAPAETVTPNLPEGDRTSFSAGLGTNLGRALHVDVAYQYIDQADRRGRTTDAGLAAPTAAVNNGLYHFHAHLVGATFAYAF